MITATTANIISAAEAQISLLALPSNAAGVGDCVRTPGACKECVRAVSSIASGHNAQRLVGIKCETFMIPMKRAEAGDKLAVWCVFCRFLCSIQQFSALRIFFQSSSFRNYCRAQRDCDTAPELILQYRPDPTTTRQRYSRKFTDSTGPYSRRQSCATSGEQRRLAEKRNTRGQTGTQAQKR